MAGKIMLDTHYDSYYPTAYCLIVDEKDNTISIDSDWDLPGVASTFGWNIRRVPPRKCPDQHSGTDGTVDCPACGTTATEFIEAAREWIDAHHGKIVNDPGYFDEYEDNE